MTPEETPPAKVVAIACTSCDEKVTASVRGSYLNEEYEVEVLLLECQECHNASLHLSEFVPDPSTNSYRSSITRRLWPNPPRELSDAVPLDLRREYGQARICFEARAYTAAAVMVRRTLEGVCIENGIDDKPLVRGLQKMRSDGLIDEKLFEWAQALRVLGNEGAHYSKKQVSQEDAQDALELAEALLDYLYVLTAKFRQFQQRRSSQSK